MTTPMTTPNIPDEVVDTALCCTPVHDGDEIAMPIDFMRLGSGDDADMILARSIMRTALTAALSARTAPTDGERQRPTDDDLWDQTLRERDEAEEALGEMFQAVTGRPAEWSSAWHYKDAIEEVEDHIAATSAPVVDLQQFVPAVEALASAALTRWHNAVHSRMQDEDIPRLRAEVDAAYDLFNVIDTARPAKAEGEARALLESLLPFAEHHESCGDADSYNNSTFQSCGCGLDSLKEAVSEFIDTARTVSRGDA